MLLPGHLKLWFYMYAAIVFPLNKHAEDCVDGTGIFAEGTGELWKEFERRTAFGAV